MLSRKQGIIHVLDHVAYHERKSWFENFDSKEEMIEDLESDNPHVYVCAMIGSGYNKKDLIEEWKNDQ